MSYLGLWQCSNERPQNACRMMRGRVSTTSICCSLRDFNQPFEYTTLFLLFVSWSFFLCDPLFSYHLLPIAWMIPVPVQQAWAKLGSSEAGKITFPKIFHKEAIQPVDVLNEIGNPSKNGGLVWGYIEWGDNHLIYTIIYIYIYKEQWDWWDDFLGYNSPT